jgi:hypothetical protein
MMFDWDAWVVEGAVVEITICIVGMVDGVVRLEAVEIALLTGRVPVPRKAVPKEPQKVSKLFKNADANLYCLICF